MKNLISYLSLSISALCLIAIVVCAVLSADGFLSLIHNDAMDGNERFPYTTALLLFILLTPIEFVASGVSLALNDRKWVQVIAGIGVTVSILTFLMALGALCMILI
jgi:hypothetical protein